MLFAFSVGKHCLLFWDTSIHCYVCVCVFTIAINPMFYPAFSLNVFSKPKMNLFRNGYTLPGQVVNTVLHISFYVEGFPHNPKTCSIWNGDVKLSVGVNVWVPIPWKIIAKKIHGQSHVWKEMARITKIKRIWRRFTSSITEEYHISHYFTSYNKQHI